MNSNVDFMGIGAQKAATSWLYTMLKQHPELWLPPRKELHYFDRSLQYASPSFLATSNYAERLRSKEPNNKIFRKKLETELLKTRNKETDDWFKKYFLSDYDDVWYKSLFEKGDGKIKGEITPAYSILNQEDILHIKNLFPKLKVIFIMRDPVERALSQIRFFMKIGKLHHSSSLEELIEFMESPNPSGRGNYIRTLNNWNAYFEKEIFIGCYDDIIADPVHFLNRVFTFLGVEPLAEKLDGIYEKVNTSDTIALEVDKELKEYLISKYIEQIETLSSKYECAKKWLNIYRR